MFGQLKAAREKKRLGRAQQEFDIKQKEFEAGAPEREKQALAQQQAQIAEKSKYANEQAEKGRQAGRADIQGLMNDPNIHGLDPEKRKALQYEAQRGLDRSFQNANRQLLGEQNMRGIRGQGGVGYAQQRDLQNMALEAQGGVQRDLTKLDADMRLKNIAAQFAGGEGRALQELLNQQVAADELQLMDERKRQRAMEDQMNRLFSRI